MSRTRCFILLASSFLMASSAFADDLGYVDCSAHPESTPVFAKPRQTPDSVATVACGERFTILLNGFIFSRVQTKDGKVGYVYSSVITADHGGASPVQSAGRAPAAPAPVAPAANPHPAVANAAANPAYAQPTSSAQAASMPVTTSLPANKPAASTGPLFPTPPVPAVTAADVNYSASSQAAPAASAAPPPTPAPAAPQPTPSPVDSQAIAKPASVPAPATASLTPSAPAPAPTPAAPAPAPAPAASTQPVAPSAASAAAEPPTSSSSTPAQTSAPAQPGPLYPAPPAPASTTPDPAPAAPAAAEPAPASQPQPEAAQPAPEPVRSVKARESWEQPVAGAHQKFLMELYGGYAFDRFTSAGTSANLTGGLGAFGWNLKPWLQLVGDSSYNFATATGAKTVLYGNHFGGRVYYRNGRFNMGRFGLTPFVEALVGGSRLDTTVTGPGGFKTSLNCISYKAGGGIDFHFSAHWEVRLINVDYYRTTLGPAGTPAQNNYWASAGVVLRLFGARSE
ncbi:MAG TPA: hypothetical protein VKB90_04560 [Candidatus Acidoferrum sp.]|nr:hypothetical protein [Candidatus Acidoferrum sp.]